MTAFGRLIIKPSNGANYHQPSNINFYTSPTLTNINTSGLDHNDSANTYFNLSYRITFNYSVK